MNDHIDFIHRIHATDHKAVIAVTGGGAEGVGELLRYGNGSNTLLEAVVPYGTTALDQFLGCVPEKYCSADTARNMAMASYQRARKLSPETVLQHIVGIGVTASLAKAGPERAGRRHFAYLAYQTHDTTYTLECEFVNPRLRHEEEELVGRLIIDMLARACQVAQSPEPTHHKKTEDIYVESVEHDYNDLVYQVVNGLSGFTTIVVNEYARERPLVLLPGSFNPIHKNHLGMAERAFNGVGVPNIDAALKNNPVDLEISVSNVDKPPLNYHTLNQRIKGVVEATKGLPYIGQLYLTNAPKFTQKSMLFPGTTFLVGFDTLRRLNDPRYSGGTAAFSNDLAQLWENKCQFVAFHRQNEEKCLNLLHDGLADLTTVVSNDLYEDDGTSSSAIRKAQSC